MILAVHWLFFTPVSLRLLSSLCDRVLTADSGDPLCPDFCLLGEGKNMLLAWGDLCPLNHLLLLLVGPVAR